MRDILSVSADTKTTKGEKIGYLTGILYLAPATISGYQVCPMAKTAGCAKACLYSAGRGAFNSVQKARIAKTKWFFEDRVSFMESLVFSVRSLVRKAKKQGLIPLVRLNGTSDIRWESIEAGNADNIMALFPDVQFYDYTKIPNRIVPQNYDITFSYSAVPAYQRHVKTAQNRGFRIAVVFRKEKDIPVKYLGMPVVSGDNSDVRHIDPNGVIVALYAKGAAKRDTSGFVVDAV